MSPRVSIVIPCRNGAAWLGEAIESCLGQSWPNLQIIVVDNGSTDGSLDLAKRYEARAVTVIVCERAGAGGSLTISGAATRPSLSSSAASVTRPRFAWRIATRGKFGAYLSLKLRLPATLVAPLAVGSAPAPLRTRRAKSLPSLSGIATHA